MAINKFIKNVKHFLANFRQQYIVDPSKTGEFSADLITANDPSCYLTEQYRNLAISIMRSSQMDASKILLFTSPQPRDGKSTTVANLGYVLARYYKKKILLIDGDLRRPHLHEIFKQEQGAGLYELLSFSGQIPDCTIKLVGNLDMIRSGILPHGVSDYLTNHEDFVKILHELKDNYDFVLIDTPPVLKVSDAGILAHAADKITLVVKAEATPDILIQQAKDLLISHNCPASAVVLTNHRQSIDLYSYVTNRHYRNYYSGFYYSYDQIIKNSQTKDV